MVWYEYVWVNSELVHAHELGQRAMIKMWLQEREQQSEAREWKIKLWLRFDFKVWLALNQSDLLLFFLFRMNIALVFGNLLRSPVSVRSLSFSFFRFLSFSLIPLHSQTVENSMNSQMDVLSSKWFSWFRLRDLLSVCFTRTPICYTMNLYFFLLLLLLTQYWNLFHSVVERDFDVEVYLFGIVKSIRLQNDAFFVHLIRIFAGFFINSNFSSILIINNVQSNFDWIFLDFTPFECAHKIKINSGKTNNT